MGALSQWSEIEAGMQTHYGLSIEDIWSMSWRRFCVLFAAIFNWTDEDNDNEELPTGKTGFQQDGTYRSKHQQAVHEARGAGAPIAHSFDWDAALGRAPADSREILTVAEIQERLSDG